MQQKGEQFAIKWPLLPTKGQIYAAAALIIFFAKTMSADLVKFSIYDDIQQSTTVC